MSSPAISVLMAVYNTERYVAEAVESILGQSFGDFEFIIIDDGSTDRSLEILQRYATQDARIRLSSRPNKGLAKTLNEGMALARGEFIARMDADDVSMPNRFALQLDYLSEHKDCVAVGTGVLYIEPFGSPLWVSDLPSTHEEIETGLLLATKTVIIHASALMRRDALESIGGYSECCGIGEDHDLFLRLAERGRLANMPEVLYKYRKNLNSITIGRSQELCRNLNEIVREAWVKRSGSVPPDLEAVLQKREPSSKSQILLTWAWAALRAGNVAVARRHALGSLWRAPFTIKSWRLMFCALRGR